MSDAVRVLDPLGDRGDARPLDTGSEHRSDLSLLRPTAVAIAIIAFVVVIVQAAPSTSLPPSTPGPAGSAAPVDVLSETVQGESPDPIVTFERFVALVNRGDSAAAGELLAEQLPTIVGVGVAEWPHLPTDAGLWRDGRLDADRVSGFVRYLFTIPGSVLVSDCLSGGDGPNVVIVTCSYVASGGVLGPLGQQKEEGHVHGIMIDGQVAGMFRHGDIDMQLWSEFASWLADSDRDQAGSVLSRDGATHRLDPVYTGDSALAQVALAIKMAAAQADDPLTYRLFGNPLGRVNRTS